MNIKDLGQYCISGSIYRFKESGKFVIVRKMTTDTITMKDAVVFTDLSKSREYAMLYDEFIEYTKFIYLQSKTKYSYLIYPKEFYDRIKPISKKVSLPPIYYI